jgi:putative transposase
MRTGRFTEEQMVAIIREADREQVSVVAKRHGVSEQTIYSWRKRFGSFEANDVRRLRQLEAENARLDAFARHASSMCCRAWSASAVRRASCAATMVRSSYRERCCPGSSRRASALH